MGKKKKKTLQRTVRLSLHQVHGIASVLKGTTLSTPEGHWLTCGW